MANELLSCPFCGGEAMVLSYKGEAWVRCQCGAVGPDVDGIGCEEKAVSVWNTRAAVTDEQFTRAIHDGRAWMAMRTCENLLDDHPCDFECSKCGFSVSTVPEGAADWQTTSWSYCPNCGAKVVE